MTPPRQPQALPPEADKGRIVCSYKGAQIVDAREHIRIVLTGPAPRGVRGSLYTEGFKASGRPGEYQRRHSPIAVITAQAICNTFFAKEQETP